MKKYFKLLGIVVFSALFIYGIKYAYDLSFHGNQKIKIIKNYKNINSIKDLTNKSMFQNKILYIDIWGVYCKPCIDEFKYVPEIKEALKNKPIEFIYLASPYAKFNDSQKWKAAIKKYKLNGYNALMNLDFYNGIWKEIPEMSDPYLIPHYILIDKNGKVANPNAPRPNEKTKLLEEINKLL